MWRDLFVKIYYKYLSSVASLGVGEESDLALERGNGRRLRGRRDSEQKAGRKISPHRCGVNRSTSRNLFPVRTGFVLSGTSRVE
jgi:hypothetical protein